MIGVLKTPRFLLKGMGGRGQGMNIVTPTYRTLCGGTRGIGDTGGVLPY